MVGLEYLKMQVFSRYVALFYVTDAISETTPFRMSLELPDKWLWGEFFYSFSPQNYVTLTMSVSLRLWRIIPSPLR